jgi:hypothetical protein
MLDYQGCGLDLTPAQNAVEAGLVGCWRELSAGRIKVFRTLQRFKEEYRIYRRDEKGKIVKKNDHLMDTMRYLYNSGFDVMKVKPSSVSDLKVPPPLVGRGAIRGGRLWRGASYQSRQDGAASAGCRWLFAAR